MRVHEMAKAKGLTSKELLDILSKGGFKLANHMAVLDESALTYINNHFDKQKKANKIETPQKGASKSSPQKTNFRNKRNFHSKSKPVVITEVAITKDMALFEAADLMGKNSSDLILELMKQGMVCNRNYVLTKDVLVSLAKEFNLDVVEENKKQKKLKTDEGVTRWPIVVVMGHVDHGKTTLLDFIRKTSVASREKGGITQHIGAYEVETSNGKLVFLDTPGHAAFSHMRKRGVRVTDIAVLVVAADDGVMPQTVEAIKAAKSAGVTIVVAINKIDKPGAKEGIENIKRQLAEHSLMAEDWGGDIVCIPLSAQTGEGVGELLDMLVLQSEMLELKADPKAPAKAFVLESNIEKGYGSVSTVICVDGTIKQGDYFLCGSTKGRVRLLINSLGEKVKQVGPSIPVKVVGFDELSSSGNVLQVVSYNEYVKNKISRPISQGFSSGEKEETINLIVKADTYGSTEAIIGLIKKISEKDNTLDRKKFAIVQSGVGGITEGDVALAKDTNSTIVAMNIRIEKNAELFAKENDVKILSHNIIYRLSEQLEEILKATEIIPTVLKKVAEAVVIKVFNIKGVGVIAGSRVRSGVFARNAKAVCIRDNQEIGKGAITSLERKNKSVKEVHIDTEFAFMTKDFQDWEVGDVVHCVIEVAQGS